MSPLRQAIGWLFSVSILFVSEGTARSQSFEKTLYLAADQVDVTDPFSVDRVVHQPVQRIILPVLEHGETLYREDGAFFPAQEKAVPVESLRRFIQFAKKKDKQVYLMCNCLRWSPSQSWKTRTDLLSRHPEFVEHANQFNESGPFRPNYATPFHPKVRQALKEFLQGLVVRFPEIDGVALSCYLDPAHLSPLGFSDAATKAYLQASGQDPRQIMLVDQTDQPVESPEVAAWRRWRLGEMAKLVHELSAAFKETDPRGRKVAVFGQADFPFLPLDIVNRYLADTLTWAKKGAVDEVILECPPGRPDTRKGYALFRSELDKIKSPVRISYLLPLGKFGEKIGYDEMLKHLRSEKVDGIALHVTDSVSFQDAEELLRLFKQFPVKEQILTRPELKTLQDDERLRVRIINLQASQVKVSRLLDRLSKSTGLTIAAEPAFANREFFSEWASINVDAYELMQMIALAKGVGGDWERTETGYQLVEQKGGRVPVPPPQAGAANGLPDLLSRNALLMIGAALALAIATVAVISWRRGQRTSASEPKGPVS